MQFYTSRSIPSPVSSNQLKILFRLFRTQSSVEILQSFDERWMIVVICRVDWVNPVNGEVLLVNFHLHYSISATARHVREE